MKTINDLTEQQWAKIHGNRAGHEQLPSRYNPYIKGFNDVGSELHEIWETARQKAKEFV